MKGSDNFNNEIPNFIVTIFTCVYEENILAACPKDQE